MGRKATLSAEERAEHRRASAKKWYQANKAKNTAGAKPRKAKPGKAKLVKKAAKHAVNKKASAKKAAKPRKASNRLLSKLGKLIKKREDLKSSLLTVADEIKACKAQIKAAK